MDGGEGGLSLIRKIAGKHIPIVIKEIMIMKRSKRARVSGISGPPSSTSSESLSLKIITMRI